MKKRTWVILGATSIIAEEFARIAAVLQNNLILVGRDKDKIKIIANDIYLRHHVNCETITEDLSKDISPLIKNLEHYKNIDLFIAHSCMLNNNELNFDKINELITINVTNTANIINAYWHKKQTEHNLIFLSSVAACRGRSKNSLYGASKAAIEIYLEGLQQKASKNQQITIARLGYIDTHVTHGMPGIFYASPPKASAKACWNAYKTKKNLIYHPFFWRFIMEIITRLPFFIYKKMKNI